MDLPEQLCNPLVLPEQEAHISEPRPAIIIPSFEPILILLVFQTYISRTGVRLHPFKAKLLFSDKIKKDFTYSKNNHPCLQTIR